MSREKLIESISKYCAEKGIEPNCELCGHDVWAPADTPLAMLVIQTSRLVAPKSGPQQAVVMTALICEKCGNVRLFIPQRSAMDDKADTDGGLS